MGARVSSEIRRPLKTPTWEAIEIQEKKPFDVFDTIFIEDCVLNVNYSIATFYREAEIVFV